MNIIYIINSTQNTDILNQVEECRDLARRLNIEVIDKNIFVDVIPSWNKNIVLENYNNIKKLILENKIKNIIIFSFDRWLLNRNQFLSEFNFLLTNNVKLYSVKEKYLQIYDLNEYENKKIKLLLFSLINSLDRIETNHRSEITIDSYFQFRGNNWGRYKINPNIKNKIIRLYEQGVSYRNIAKQIKIKDKKNNLKNISIGSIFNIISEYKNSDLNDEND